MDPQTDIWTDPIPAISLTRKIRSLPHSDLGSPEQNILGANVSNSKSPFLCCLAATETQSSPFPPTSPTG